MSSRPRAQSLLLFPEGGELRVVSTEARRPALSGEGGGRSDSVAAQLPSVRETRRGADRAEQVIYTPCLVAAYAWVLPAGSRLGAGLEGSQLVGQQSGAGRKEG